MAAATSFLPWKAVGVQLGWRMDAEIRDGTRNNASAASAAADPQTAVATSVTDLHLEEDGASCWPRCQPEPPPAAGAAAATTIGPTPAHDGVTTARWAPWPQPSAASSPTATANAGRFPATDCAIARSGGATAADTATTANPEVPSGGWVATAHPGREIARDLQAGRQSRQWQSPTVPGMATTAVQKGWRATRWRGHGCGH